MKTIELTQGKLAIVDDADFENLSQFAWYAAKHRKTFYAMRSGGYRDGKQLAAIRMHRQIVGAKVGEQVDHRDGNGLDNRRENLRFCDSVSNARNRRLESKGVRRRGDRPRGKRLWNARITVDRKTRSLSWFETQEQARAAYDAAERELFGEFASSHVLT